MSRHKQRRLTAGKRRLERLERKLEMFRSREEDTQGQEAFVRLQIERLKQLEAKFAKK